MSVLRKLASQTAVYGLSTMVGRFLNFLLVPLYTARLAGVGDYGQVSVMFSYASFLAVIFTYGMETGFFNFARKADNPGKVFSTATIALICSGLILVLCSNAFADPLMNLAGYPGHSKYAIWFGIILASDAITSIGFAWLRFNEKPWHFAAIRLLNIAINFGSNLFFLIACPWLLDHGYTWVSKIYNPQHLIDYIFLSNLFASFFIVPLFAKTWMTLKHGFDFTLFRSMLRYSLPMVVVGLAGMVNETLDRILLKQILPKNIADYEVGIYSAFYKLSLILTLFVQAFRFAAEPFFFKHSGTEDAKETYAYVMKWFVYVCGLIYVGTMVFLPWLGPLLLRNKTYFADPRGMAIVPVLLMANFFLGIYYNLSVWYKLSDKTMLGAVTALIGAGLTLIINFTLIPAFSFEASAWATFAAYLSMVLTGFFLGQKYYHIPYKTFNALAILIASALLGYLATQYNSIAPVASFLCMPAYLLLVWRLELKKKAKRIP